MWKEEKNSFTQHCRRASGSIVNAMGEYQAMLDAIRDGLVNKAKAGCPDDPQERADHLKAFGYFSDASMVGTCLLPDEAPMHVSSTIYLAECGFYDGLKFHRIINGFMAQGGCPLGNGMGGPAYGYNGEFRADVNHSTPGISASSLKS